MNFQIEITILNMFCEELLGIPAELPWIYVQVAKPINERFWLLVFVGFYFGFFYSPFPVGLCGLHKTLFCPQPNWMLLRS